MARVKRVTALLAFWIAVVVPTAQMSVGETAEMLESTAFAKPVPDGTAGTGTGTMVHAVPSQCAARVLWLAALMLFVLPTAQASFGPLAETPSRRSSWRTMFVVGVCCHCVPFQCSAKICRPASSPAPWTWPTAQASLAVRAEMSLRVVADGLTLGTTVQAGVAAMAVPANRASEAPAASATGMSRCRMLVPSWLRERPVPAPDRRKHG